MRVFSHFPARLLVRCADKNLLNIEYKHPWEASWWALIISVAWNFYWISSEAEATQKSCEFPKVSLQDSAKSFNLAKIKTSCTMNKFHFSFVPYFLVPYWLLAILRLHRTVDNAPRMRLQSITSDTYSDICKSMMGKLYWMKIWAWIAILVNWFYFFATAAIAVWNCGLTLN